MVSKSIVTKKPKCALNLYDPALHTSWGPRASSIMGALNRLESIDQGIM